MLSISRCTLLLPLAAVWSRPSAAGQHLAVSPDLDLVSIARALAPGNTAVAFGRTVPADPSDDPRRTTGADRLFALVLHSDGELTRVDLGPTEAIAVAVSRWREAIREPLRRDALVPGPEEGEARARGEELRALVLDPVLAAAGDPRMLSICPVGPLHLVSFDALPFDRAGDRAGTLVGDRVAIACITSFADLLLPHAEGAEDPTLLTFSTVGFSAVRFSAVRSGTSLLPTWSDRLDEVHAVEDAFNSAFHGREELIAGPGATKASFSDRSRNASFVHVVTEGRLAERLPWDLAPSLALSASPRADSRDDTERILTVEELGALDLSRCEMAVLSTSGSHAGPLRPGGGVRSLCAAAHRAGARTALGSLWEIDEEAAAELMTRFYARLWIDRQPPASALWDAKMELRRTGRPTREWAGWVLVGAPD